MNLYKVQIGYIEDDGTRIAWRIVNVVAEELTEVIKKTPLKKDEYLVAAEIIAVVDVK